MKYKKIEDKNRIFLTKVSNAILFLPSPLEIDKLKNFVFEKWVERYVEQQKPKPCDTSGSCKFSSLFIKRLYGGEITGNSLHQWNILENGVKIDICEDNIDVEKIWGLRRDPYDIDNEYLFNPDHLRSMISCLPRVDTWVSEFLLRYQPDFEPLITLGMSR